MSKEKLKKAREFEQEQLKRISPEERPCYHVTGGSGWINDPNGFSFYKDEYHLFYQYHPYSNEWGPMHWGHVTSKDLITWERLPLAMALKNPMIISDVSPEVVLSFRMVDIF